MADRVESQGEQRWRLFLWLCAALRGDRPDWPADPADTQPLIALAGEHFITPTLGILLEDASGLPEPVRDYLGAVVLLNRARNAAILAGVENAAAMLADHGIPAVFLKGAAHLADGLYPDPACRFLGDVDVLVPRSAATAAIRALAEGGFSDVDPPLRRWIAPRRHDSPIQRHVDTGVGIEVHREVMNLAYPGLLPADAILHTARSSSCRPDVLIPSPRHRILHAILHDQLNDGWRYRTCSLRSLCDVSQLLKQPDAADSFNDLTSNLPSKAGRLIAHVLALAGLLGIQADPAETERACARLRTGVQGYKPLLSDSLLSRLQRLRYQPWAAINLLDLRRWSEWLARHWSPDRRVH